MWDRRKRQLKRKHNIRNKEGKEEEEIRRKVKKKKNIGETVNTWNTK
jgi:hypothetical protein